jgi:2-hydroxychromene-2-carboxylate isomerase
VDFQQRAILKAALTDIENLAAPRHIDQVSAALGMDMVQFAKLGADGMKQAIYSRLLLGNTAATSVSIVDQKRWRDAAQIKLPSASSTRN